MNVVLPFILHVSSFRGWAGLDLNQRRRSQRIYSPPPLTTRAPTRSPTDNDINTGCSASGNFFKKLWALSKEFGVRGKGEG
jgi:hypothetical protein